MTDLTQERAEPDAEIEDLEPREKAEEVRGGRRPPHEEPRPPTPPGVPIPYPNT